MSLPSSLYPLSFAYSKGESVWLGGELAEVRNTMSPSHQIAAIFLTNTTTTTHNALRLCK